MSDSEVGYDVWGALNGTVSIVAAIFSLVAWLLRRLPRAKMPALCKTLKETEKEFDKAVNDGLIHGGNGIWLRLRLWALQLRTEDVAAQIHDISSWTEDWSHWRAGTCDTISLICNDLTRLRAALAKTSSRERRELASSGYLTKLATWSGLAHQLSRPTQSSSSSTQDPAAECVGLPHAPTLLAGMGVMLGFAPMGLPTEAILGSHTEAPPAYNTAAPTASIRLPFRDLPPSPARPKADLPAKVEDEPVNIVFHKDLDDILSYAAAANIPSSDGSSAGNVERARATPKELLRRVGKQLLGSDKPERWCSDSARAPPKVVRQQLMRMFGVHARRIAAAQNILDPESLVPHGAGGGDDRDAKDEEWFYV